MRPSLIIRKKKKLSRSAKLCSCAAQGRMTLPAPPATRNRGSAYGCRGLPNLSEPAEARKVVGEWPAYRVSSTHVMTMQHRLYDCYWQMRMPELEMGSDVSVALIAYLTKTAEGGDISAPSLKR